MPPKERSSPTEARLKTASGKGRRSRPPTTLHRPFRASLCAGAVLDTATIMAQHCRHRDRDRWVPDTSVSEGSENMTTSKHRKGANSIEPVAGNGLLDRRALLSHGAALAGAMGVGAAGAATGAAAEPLAVDPWTLTPGIPVPAYGVPSRFEDKTVRTLTNPKGEPRGSGARTPHHLLNGTITPNGLHMVVARGGIPVPAEPDTPER